MSVTLDDALKGEATKRIKTMVQLVYQACHDTFGVKGGQTAKPPSGPSRRQRQITELRKELRTLKKRWRKADAKEKTALNELSSELRKTLMQLRKTKTNRKKQSEKRRQRKAFFNNPFQFTAGILGKPKSGRLTCTREEVEGSVAAAHSDPSRDIPLGTVHSACQ